MSDIVESVESDVCCVTIGRVQPTSDDSQITICGLPEMCQICQKTEPLGKIRLSARISSELIGPLTFLHCGDQMSHRLSVEGGH